MSRTSEIIEETQASLVEYVLRGEGLPINSTIALARLLRFFAASCREMEERLAGREGEPKGENIVSLAAFVASRTTPNTSSDPTPAA